MFQRIPVMVLCMFADSVRRFVDNKLAVLTVQAAVDLKLTEPILTVTQPMYSVVVAEHCKFKQKTLKFCHLRLDYGHNIYISCLSILPCCDNFLSADSTLSKVTASFAVLLYCSKAANSADVLREL